MSALVLARPIMTKDNGRIYLQVNKNLCKVKVDAFNIVGLNLPLFSSWAGMLRMPRGSTSPSTRDARDAQSFIFYFHQCIS